MQTQLKQDLSSFSREELEARIHQLEAHNKQLKNILDKATNTGRSQPRQKISRRGKVFDFSKHQKRHILLKFAYLGWDRQGYAVQEDSNNTVEAALFDALCMTKLIESRESSNYHRCGRTDKGVSAFSQVISITVRSRLPNKETGDVDTQVLDENHQEEINYAQTLNRVLPLDIRVLAWSPAQEGFSARFDCTARTYKYFFPRANLNLDAMNEAAQHLVGEKDYRNLCKMDIGNGVVHFKRRILAVSLKQMERDHEDSSPSGYEMCVATIDGVAFLWHQIRAIMTVLLLVGEGKEEPDIVLKLLDVEAVKRKPQYGFASEIGLNLYDTNYEEVSWNYDEENISIVISQLQMMWAEHAMKSAMTRHMLDDLSMKLISDLQGEKVPQDQARLCNQDPRTKIYKPLLERPTCESLEERVKHFVKRRRLNPSVLENVKKQEESKT